MALGRHGTALIPFVATSFLAVAAATSACSLDVSGAETSPTGAADASVKSGAGKDAGAGNRDASGANPGDDDDGNGDANDVDGDGDPDATGGSDASGNGCDLSGTWANLVTIDVSWAPQGVTGVFLAPGKGVIRQWIRSRRAMTGADLVDTDILCGIELPDFDGSAFAGGEHYGVRFPDTMFDSGILAPFGLNWSVTSPNPGGTMTSAVAAVLLGLTLPSPKTDPWPMTVTTASDDDGDGEPGVTVTLAQGAGYNNLPVNLTGGRADRLNLAIRQLTSVSATVSTCDRITGTVTIPSIQTSSGDKPAIDSHVIGCDVEGDAGACTAQSASFIDATQPVFVPNGASTFTSIRVPDSADCPAVRGALP